MYFPDEIKWKIGQETYQVDQVGMSQAKIFCFEHMVLKVDAQLEREYRMMNWLSGRLPVPQIIYFTRENGLDYLLMSRIEGNMACSEEMLEDPNQLVRLLADGLKMLWKVDPMNCPYCNSLEYRLQQAQERVERGLCDVENAEPGTFGKDGFHSPKELLMWLRDNRPEEELVFSHGDFSLPNIFCQNNRLKGFIDLGNSGIADRYQDIALCYRSLNDVTYGGKTFQDFDAKMLFDELSIVPDWEKIRYYILLDELF